MATTSSLSTPLARQLVLDEPELRSQLLAHLARASDAATAGAAHPDLATGVHQVRKAARRVRAIAALMGGGLGRRELRTIIEAIRQARQALGPARDHAVAGHLIAHLVLDEPVREAAKLVLQAAARDMPSAEDTRTALEDSAGVVVAQAQVLRAAVPERVTFALLVDGVQDVYRRARRARKAAKRDKRAFHAWRRRSKELAYQLDVLGDLAGERLAKLRAAIDELAHDQRDAVDVLMLRDFVRAHRDRVDPETSDLVLAALGVTLKPRLQDLRRAGRAAFTQKPRKLARSACRSAPQS